MKTEQLYAILIVMMEEEQKSFRDYLMKCPPQKIMFSAPEYVVRDQILECMDVDLLDDEQIVSLIESGTPLSNIYSRFEESQLDVCDCYGIYECIVEEAEYRVALMNSRLDMDKDDEEDECW